MSTPIENNTEGLLEILQTVNNLPEAGSGVRNQDITITENGTYTPESGFTGFGKVTAEIDFPDAEDAVFGTAGQASEPAIITFPGKKDWGNKITAGYKFTANSDIAVVGLHTELYSSTKPVTVRLWDDETGEQIASHNFTASGEVLLSNPVILRAGKSYVLSTHGAQSYYQSYYPNNFSSTNPATSPKITFVNGYIHFSKMDTIPTSVSSQYMAYANMLIADVEGEVPSEYKVQKATMDGISDEVKRITGASGTLTLAQIKTALQGIASTG